MYTMEVYNMSGQLKFRKKFQYSIYDYKNERR